MSGGPRPIGEWPDALEAALGRCTALRSASVLRETGSTQDHARAYPAGHVTVAWRQVAGRGRHGRSWVDTGHDGLALSANLPCDAPERLAARAAVAAAEAVEQCALDAGRGSPRVRIKWPNDLWIEGRKLGGILVEQDPERAIVGIGINVSQRSLPESIAARATSLAIQGFDVDRLDLACHLVQRLDAWVHAPDDALRHAYSARDALAGTRCSLSTPEGIVEGAVLACDPIGGMRVRTSAGDRLLPAATTSVLESIDRTTA